VDAKTEEPRAAHDDLATAVTAGDGEVRRGGPTLGTGFDVYWLSPAQLEQYVTGAGFSVTFWAPR
jgi:hypothetical protein